jgi:hypothetical protein
MEQPTQDSSGAVNWLIIVLILMCLAVFWFFTDH